MAEDGVRDILATDSQTVIIALDGSEESEYAVNWYTSKNHRPGNKLIFLHCVELPEMSLNQARRGSMNQLFELALWWKLCEVIRKYFGSLHMSPGVLASMWKEEETKTKALEAKLRATLKEKGLKGVLRTASGKPGEVICRIAEEEDAVLIVVGTRGLGKVRRTLLGSVSDYLVNHAVCPVVVCRRPGSKSRRTSSSSDGNRSRNASGDKSRHASGDKSRHTSGDKSRHFSGSSSTEQKSKRTSRNASVSDDVFS